MMNDCVAMRCDSVGVRQHHEKNGLLLWKRCVNEEKRLEDVRDLKSPIKNRIY